MIRMPYKKIRWTAAALAAAVVLYFALDLLLMPLYTRHWQSVEVPNVIHLSYRAAEKLLDRAGLRSVKGAEKYDENFPPGFVLFQNPEAGSRVKKGRRIYLTVGRGGRVFDMPKLVGVSERDARFVLERNHLELGEVNYELDAVHPEGVVSAQSIEPGLQVSISESVDLVVSLGIEPMEFYVPKVVGKSLDEAEVAVKKAGLVLGGIRYQRTDKLLPNTVISQLPEPGLEVERADTVQVVVSELYRKVETPW